MLLLGVVVCGCDGAGHSCVVWDAACLADSSSRAGTPWHTYVGMGGAEVVGRLKVQLHGEKSTNKGYQGRLLRCSVAG